MPAVQRSFPIDIHVTEQASLPGIDLPEETSQCPFFISILPMACGSRIRSGLDCANESDARKTADLIARQIAIDLDDGDRDRSVVVVDEDGSEIYTTPVKA